MTLGFAGAAWTDNDDRLVVVAADTRLSSEGNVLTDAGVKTYELGGRSALVASGHALPPMMAAELTRSLIENHNRRTPERPVNFVDTVRLLGFFLKRAAEQQGASSRVAVTGFQTGAEPCIASVVASPGFNRAAFVKVSKGGTVALPVGDAHASRLLLESMAQAKREAKPAIASALGMLCYVAKVQGAFQTVGGGISVGTCAHTASCFSWPIIEMDGRLFLRGMEVTRMYRAGWPKPEVIPYDEAWCVAQDRRLAATAAPSMEPEPGERKSLPGLDLDAITPETLFATHDEPEL